ncbi:ATP-binding protein [Mycolicibacterium xanthum]|uniref:ATP-binding protein n=1 Tax=Mycolicibacterium xanthum TaxID=2796469 RepID=UPI0027E1420A|nr:adenylate/guanylate cyclase domain-containing protein [Mycolicibacterium xanthum]
MPTAVAPDPAKYKQVTVLFADVVRSMDIAAVLELERLREILTELVERSVAVVRRYGGGTVEYTGDGLMALFGAPVALEDHALRACLAALAIQDEANRLAAELHERDGVALQLRVGLNSGRVIAGEVAIGTTRYAATGEPLGMAQRIESAAEPGAVMVSESTARLVERLAELGEPQWVHVKGAAEPVLARLLTAVKRRQGMAARAEASLVGRRAEMAILDALVERTVAGLGAVVNVIGPPGIGKSRVAREAAVLAAERGVSVVWASCESHTNEAPFGAVTTLLRAAFGVAELTAGAARVRVRAMVPEAAPDDLLMLEDLLDIADPGVPMPSIDRDARRRRLIALVNTATLARTEPALFVIEDVHWIDSASESLLTEFLSVVERTPSAVVVTARPEYRGDLAQLSSGQTIALAPLADSETIALLGELLGTDPSVVELARVIAGRAAGNPFFAEEMVRELAQRGVLVGESGRYRCNANVAEVSVPATVQAAIQARIDRLSAPARRTVNAASVIGGRFDEHLLAALDVNPVLDELLGAHLLDQVQFTPFAEYAFCHPLIRAVAYESQLKTTRAQWHRCLATAIQERAPESAEQNAALIAEHLEAAGELPVAYGWHMRAGAWSAGRDVGAARISWERAQQIADRLPAEDSDQLSLRIAPRVMLCVTDWQARPVQKSWGRFAELRDLCTEAGDKVSLAVGMTGLATELLYAGRPGEGSRLAAEQMELLESIGDPTMTVGLSFLAFANWFNSGDFDEILRWSQTAIELADGDPTMGADFGVGSPLAIATAFRGIARYWLGRSGWQDDLDDAVTLSRSADPATLALVVAWTFTSVFYGAVRFDDELMRMLEDAMQLAHGSSNDFAVTGAHFGLGAALLYRRGPADGARGLELMLHARDRWLPERAPSLVPLAELLAGREMATCGDRDTAIGTMHRAARQLQDAGRLGWSVLGTSLLVETLLADGGHDGVRDAEEAIGWLAQLQGERPAPMVEVTLLRLRALLACATGDEVTRREAVGRYRAMAESLGFEGHVAWAEEMAIG